MRRSSRYLAEPPDDDGFVERVRAFFANLLDRLGDDRPRQALPLSRYRGQTGPVIPYHERRQQLRRSRRRQHSSYTFVFVLTLFVLVAGIYYGFSMMMGGLSRGETRAVPAPTIVSEMVAPTPQSSPVALFLPTPAAVAAANPTSAPAGAAAPTPAPASTPVPAAATPPPGPGTPDTGAQRTYVIQSGDTPANIARQFNVPTDVLMRANGIADPRTLRVGDTLIIPPAPTATPAPR